MNNVCVFLSAVRIICRKINASGRRRHLHRKRCGKTADDVPKTPTPTQHLGSHSIKTLRSYSISHIFSGKHRHAAARHQHSVVLLYSVYSFFSSAACSGNIFFWPYCSITASLALRPMEARRSLSSKARQMAMTCPAADSGEKQRQFSP